MQAIRTVSSHKITACHAGVGCPGCCKHGPKSVAQPVLGRTKGSGPDPMLNHALDLRLLIDLQKD
jgi:hypothetical protein